MLRTAQRHAKIARLANLSTMLAKSRARLATQRAPQDSRTPAVVAHLLASAATAVPDTSRPLKASTAAVRADLAVTETPAALCVASSVSHTRSKMARLARHARHARTSALQDNSTHRAVAPRRASASTAALVSSRVRGAAPLASAALLGASAQALVLEHAWRAVAPISTRMITTLLVANPARRAPTISTNVPRPPSRAIACARLT